MPDIVAENSKPEVAGSGPTAFHNDLHKTIVLMRHAEKPDDPSDPDLSPEGRARADKLATYIQDHFHQKPDYLFAADESKHSLRPIETLEPLSQKTGVPLDHSIANEDYQDLADELKDPKFDGKFIVIAWHHGKIPALAEALGAPVGTFPRKWNENDFDHYLEFDYDSKGNPKVTEIAENLDNTIAAPNQKTLGH